MTIEESSLLRLSWKATLLTSSKLTPFQIMDLENIKEDDKTSIELLDYHSLNSQLRQLFKEGKYDAIISRLSKLPLQSLNLDTVKVLMPTGKKIPYLAYLKIAEARMDSGQEALEIKFIAKKHKNLAKKYKDMSIEEFQSTLFGRTMYNPNGQLIKSSEVAFQLAWNELLSVIDSSVEYYQPVELAEWMNNNSCVISSLFYSETIFSVFLQWLANNGHVDRNALKGVNLDIQAACKGLLKSKVDIDTID